MARPRTQPVVDLTVSPPGPRPLVANATIAPRRPFRDGSTSRSASADSRNSSNSGLAPGSSSSSLRRNHDRSEEYSRASHSSSLLGMAPRPPHYYATQARNNAVRHISDGAPSSSSRSDSDLSDVGSESAVRRERAGSVHSTDNDASHQVAMTGLATGTSASVTEAEGSSSMSDRTEPEEDDEDEQLGSRRSSLADAGWPGSNRLGLRRAASSAISIKSGSSSPSPAPSLDWSRLSPSRSTGSNSLRERTNARRRSSASVRWIKPEDVNQDGGQATPLSSVPSRTSTRFGAINVPDEDEIQIISQSIVPPPEPDSSRPSRKRVRLDSIEPVDLTDDNDAAALRSKIADGSDQRKRKAKGKAKETVAAVGIYPNEPEENLLSAFQCPICLSPPTSAVLTPCGHIMCGACLFATLKSQNIRERRRPTEPGVYPTTSITGKKLRKRPSVRGRIVLGNCPVCRNEIDGGMSTIPGEGGVKYLEIATITLI